MGGPLLLSARIHANTDPRNKAWEGIRRVCRRGSSGSWILEQFFESKLLCQGQICESIPTNMADRDVATKSPESDAPDDINIIPEDTSAHEGASMGVCYAIKP